MLWCLGACWEQTILILWFSMAGASYQKHYQKLVKEVTGWMCDVDSPGYCDVKSSLPAHNKPQECSSHCQNCWCVCRFVVNSSLLLLSAGTDGCLVRSIKNWWRCLVISVGARSRCTLSNKECCKTSFGACCSCSELEEIPTSEDQVLCKYAGLCTQ